MLKTTQQQRAIVGPLKQDGQALDPKTEPIMKAAGLRELAGRLASFQPKEREAERKTLDAIGELLDSADRDEKLLVGVAIVARMDFWLGHFRNKVDIRKKTDAVDRTKTDTASKDAEDMTLRYIRLLHCLGPFASSILKKATMSLNERICTAACDALGTSDWQTIYNHSDAILHPNESSI